MVKSNKTFKFDENAVLEDNLAAFGSYLSGTDAVLGEELGNAFSKLREESVDQPKIWNALYSAAEVSEKSNADEPAASAPDQPVAVSAATTQIVPVNPTAGVTGWLLEGISIEGFRGINNEGKPLELKFRADKINSISAVNGVGKTSVYDAIRYAISGRLPWLDELPATDRDGEYYLNRFNASQKATIKLKLVADGAGPQCEIVVTRDKLGNRKVTATSPFDGDAILHTLDREFVLLDGPTFQNFIAAKPQARGRTFSGLLGLSEYSRMRQALAGLANVRSFNNHFNVSTHAQKRAHEEKAVKDSAEAIQRDFVILTGEDWVKTTLPAMLDKCHHSLVQIGPLAEHCVGKTFGDIDIEACIESIKASEGGPKRERLRACIQEREELRKLNIEAPDVERSEKLVGFAKEREEAVSKTAGDLMLQLFQAGAKALELPELADTNVCPLCDSETPHNLQSHVNGKLANFTALDEATQKFSLEWSEAGWADLGDLEKLLESNAEARLIAKLSNKGQRGVMSSEEATSLVSWLKGLRIKAQERDMGLASEQQSLEKELPQSSVEVTKKIEAARRLQESVTKVVAARDALKVEADREARVSRVKSLLDRASAEFATAEAAISKARLAAVEPVFKANFDGMSFYGVEPAVSKRATSEDLQIRLADFHGLKDLSPQALLSESFRNAFAISLYLAAASLYGGMPKFIVLDDVTSSFDAGHQLYLVELLRKTFARPANPAGLQVILLSHDTMLEKLFNKHSSSGLWWHQRLEGMPQLAVFAQAGAVNKVRDQTISQLQAGQVDSAKEGVRQYLEYRLNDLISRLRIPVPVDVAFNENKQLASEFLGAIDAAVKLHQAANSIVLTQAQLGGLNTNMATIVGNFLSHWGTGQTLSFTGSSLLGVMKAIDGYFDCFTFEPLPGATPVFYKTLSQRT